MSRWLWGLDAPLRTQYDEMMHEHRAATNELKTSVEELQQAAQRYIHANNPLIALTITLLNQQQMRPDPHESESHPGNSEH